MSPDAQFYVSKNLNVLRDKFAGFVEKFIEPKEGEVAASSDQESEGSNKVIKTEDVCQFFEEMGQVRK